MGGEKWYPVEYGNHFHQIFFAFLLAECHKKVATIISILLRPGAPPQLTVMSVLF
jgi:hypothetical protein